MIIIPAIDIKNGRCVRLRQGQMDSETVYGEYPAQMALKWQSKGAQQLHVVDLDGAVKKDPQNTESIQQIVKGVNIPVQVGGGIRNEATIKRYLDMGVNRVIIGTEAISNPEMVKRACRDFPDSIVVGIDARRGNVAIDGWTKTTDVKAVDLARHFEDCGVSAIVFTDIFRDGMQTGPNLEETQRLAEAVNIPVIASGGVSTIDDIKNLIELEAFGIVGIITGKALYNNTLNLEEAISLTKSGSYRDID